MKRIIAVAILSVTVLPNTAIAQDEVDDGLYFRVGAGANFVSDMQQSYLFDPAISGIPIFCPPGFSCPAVLLPTPTGQSVSLDSGMLAVVALGFDYADGIRTELEYRNATTDISSAPGDSGWPGRFTPRPNDNVNAQFLMANFYFDFYNNTPFTPFIGGGVGGAFVRDVSGIRDAALAYQARTGVSLGLGDGLSADVEYIYVRTNEFVFGPSTDLAQQFGVLRTTLTKTGRYESSAVMLSVRVEL